MFKLTKKLEVNHVNRENGFTMMEVLVALVILSVLFIMVLNVYTLAVGKSNYISTENEIIGFEQDVGSWLEKDYRENNIDNITVVTEGDLPTLIFNLKDKTQIEYKNKSNGFYRVKPGESRRIGDSQIVNILQDGNAFRLTYRLGNGEKTLVVKLDK